MNVKSKWRSIGAVGVISSKYQTLGEGEAGIISIIKVIKNNFHFEGKKLVVV